MHKIHAWQIDCLKSWDTTISSFDFYNVWQNACSSDTQNNFGCQIVNNNEMGPSSMRKKNILQFSFKVQSTAIIMKLTNKAEQVRSFLGRNVACCCFAFNQTLELTIDEWHRISNVLPMWSTNTLSPIHFNCSIVAIIIASWIRLTRIELTFYVFFFGLLSILVRDNAPRQINNVTEPDHVLPNNPISWRIRRQL